MKINFAVLCVSPSNKQYVEHVVVYEEEPTEDDLFYLKEELESDESLGMVGIEYDIIVVDRKVSPEIFKELSLPEEVNEDDVDGNKLMVS